MAAQVQIAPGAAGLPLVEEREAQVDASLDTQFHGAPSAFVIGRNNKNTHADNAGNSTLAEPAAANHSRMIFAAGNFSHAEFSTDAGVNWVNVPIPGGPIDAPTPCCDHDVVIDDGRRVVFHSVLYINGTLSRGVVRIFVRPSFTAPAACAYDIFAGAADAILRDYPHLGMTRNHLWLGTNEIGAVYPGGQAARMYRFAMDAMADCGAVPFSVFQFNANVIGQRIFVPAEGANLKEAMYWGMLVNATTFRVFRWHQTAAAPTQQNFTVSASTFGDPDCRGGTGNFDFIRSIDASLLGFGLRGAVGHDTLAFYWMVAADTAHTQGHIHGAVFRLLGADGLVNALIGQPPIFNNNFCTGFPMVTANKRGDYGMSFAHGGRAGGGGTAAQGAVMIADDFSSSAPGVFTTFVTTAGGTHNRSDNRFGDYFTIHPYEPCEKWFFATNYALSGGTAVANVNYRVVEFGRNRDFRCYAAFRNQFPETPGTTLTE
jgi:hypothetical protein